MSGVKESGVIGFHQEQPKDDESSRKSASATSNRKATVRSPKITCVVGFSS